MNSQQHNVKRQPTKGKSRRLTPDLYCDSTSNQAAWGDGACLPPCPDGLDFLPIFFLQTFVCKWGDGI